jgi:hypothetical protein
MKFFINLALFNIIKCNIFIKTNEINEIYCSLGTS